MILQFPNVETLRLAMTSGIISPDNLLAATAWQAGADGQFYLNYSGKLLKKLRDELSRLNVLTSKLHPTDSAMTPAANWFAVLPLLRNVGPLQLAAQTPVLFQMPSATLPMISAEMLRLGNDRQGFRWIDNVEKSALLRVIGPPYYTLLRAIDADKSTPIRAYVEQAPRIWVELGYHHPLVNSIRVADDQTLLIHAPRSWIFLANEPFQDVYAFTQFTLPHIPEDFQDITHTTEITVPLRLVPGDAADVPDFWVIAHDGVRQLDSFVRGADERLLEQLLFAVATGPDDREIVVLKTRPSRKSPPILTLNDTIAYKPYSRLPNLYHPVGMRLHPTIRRDVVAKLLAEDREKIVWLSPGDNGTFTPESLPEQAFRSLHEWVEYIIDRNRTPLAEWIDASVFEFDSFVCNEATTAKKVAPDKPGRDRKPEVNAEVPTRTKATTKVPVNELPFAESPKVQVAIAKPPNEWKLRCDELEKAFLENAGRLDDPKRIALWPQLAEANAGIGEGRRSEAAICWLNAMWNDTAPPTEWLTQWVASECLENKQTTLDKLLDGCLRNEQPTPSDVRQFCAIAIRAAADVPVADWFKARLGAVQQYLGRFEDRLPIRAVWLTALRLAQMSGSDVLGLARVRDRLLMRLLDRGLSPEQDLPSFLRYAGLHDAERMRVVREKAQEVFTVARLWASRSLSRGLPNSEPHPTLAYIDLAFSFTFAKLGDAITARRLMDSAKTVLIRDNPSDAKAISSTLLFRAYAYRIEEAIAGKPHAGMLPEPLRDEIESLLPKKPAGETRTPNEPRGLAHYAIARMREQSKILEPQEMLNAQTEYLKHVDELKIALAELPKIADDIAMMKSIRQLYHDGVRGKATEESRFYVLHDSLPLAARVGQDFTVELLDEVPRAMKYSPPAGTPFSADFLKKQGQLLERAMFYAAHFDRTEMIHTLVDHFVLYLRKLDDEPRYELVNIVVSQCIRSLKKVGLRDDIDRLLRRIQEEVLRGKTLAQLKSLYSGKPNIWVDALQTLLNLAAGWLSFGIAQEADAILDAGRAEILNSSSDFKTHDFSKLCETYIGVLGQCPADVGMTRMIDLFQTIDPARTTNTFTSGAIYSRLHLSMIEAVASAIVSEDSALGQAGKRWLDEDEHLVRQRIHNDVRNFVAKSGL